MRIYLANLTEFDLINSFHLHGDFFRYQPTGTGDNWEYTDTVDAVPGPARRHRDPVREHRAASCSTRTSPSSPSSAGWASSRSSTRWRPARRPRGPRASAGACGRSCRCSCWRSPSASVVSSGSSLVELIGTNPPPADEFDIRRVEFSPGEIRITVRNPQPDDLTIANVNVDDAIVPFTVDGPTTLGRLRSSTIVVPFDWVEDDPITVGVTSSTGIETVEEIPAAIETPEPSVEGFLGYALIGALVGIVPVALGLLWLPALRQASAAWLSAFMAFTAGLLTFLGVEALSEAFELQALLPAGLGGSGLVLLGVALSFLGMTALSGAAAAAGRRRPASRSRSSSRSASASTTSARGSRSGRRSRSASSSSGRS